MNIVHLSILDKCPHARAALHVPMTVIVRKGRERECYIIYRSGKQLNTFSWVSEGVSVRERERERERVVDMNETLMQCPFYCPSSLP